jgi:sugar lactone lactonase YvrE
VPNDVAAASDGSFLIADVHGRRVDRVAADGAITVAASRPGKPCEPDTVTASADGSLLVGDGSSRRVWRAGAGGRLSVVAGGGFVFGTTRG